MSTRGIKLTRNRERYQVTLKTHNEIAPLN